VITPIEKISPIVSATGTEATSGVSTGGVGNPFGSVFQSAIQNVRDTEAEKNQAEYLLATGQLDNPSTLMIALTKNSTAVDLLVQLRNKALDAYSELTRISI
jgi:flagellar hook-basal body complex protein FliE